MLKKILITMIMAAIYQMDPCVAVKHYNILSTDGGGMRGLIPA